MGIPISLSLPSIASFPTNATATILDQGDAVLAAGVRCFLATNKAVSHYGQMGGMTTYILRFPAGTPHVANQHRVLLTQIDGFDDPAAFPLVYFSLANVLPVPGLIPYIQANADTFYGARPGGG